MLLGDRVLGRRCIGRVERFAEGVTFGLRESDPAGDQPLLPIRIGRVLNLGVGDHRRLELIPVECPGFGLGAGLWRGGWFLRVRK